VPRIPAAQRRRDFIHAAVEVIATHGIEGATTRRIAEQANANLAMLHYCYDSKEDLLGEVYEFVNDRFRAVAQDADPNADLADAARRLLRGVMECYLESVSFTATTLELISWARRQHGDRGIAVYEQALETARAVLRSAPSNDPVDPDVIDQIAYVIGTLSDGFALNWLTYGDQSAAAQQMDITVSVLDGWLAKKLQPSYASS
jgi:AcrR family transcriptional regulator